MFTGLKGKFLAFFLVLDLSTLGVIVLTVSRDAQRSLRDEVKQRVALRITEMSKAIQDELQVKWMSMRDLAANSFLRNSVIDTLGRNEYLVPFMQKLTLPGAGGDTAIVSLLDFKGRVIAQNVALPKVAFHDTRWLPLVLNTGQPHAELFARDDTTKIVLAFPIYYLKYAEGVLVAEFDLSSFAQGYLRDKEFQAALVDRSWRPLLSGVPEAVATKLQRDLEVQGQPPVFLEEAGILYAALPFHALAGTEEFAWTLVLATRLQNILAPAHELSRRTVQIGIITAFVLACIVLWRMTAFVRPIQRLEETMRTIMEHKDLSKRVPVSSHDELGALAGTFNQMLADLQKIQQELQGREQTLQQSNEELVRQQRALQSLLEDLQRSKDQLQQQQQVLQEANVKLQQSNKELDDFTYTVSHDLKEPLRSIEAFSKFLVQDYQEQLQGEGKGFLERIRANAKRMGDLIEDLLELSRLSRRANQLTEVNVADMIEEVKQRLAYAIMEKRVELVVQGSLPTISCDRVRLTEVFANLVSNAVKYNDKPAPRIEIGYHATEQAHEFTVKDNGPGIPAEYFEKVFEMFQRLTKREDQEGTGIGLTIVKKIVELHGGRVWVESAVGQGAIFHFTIPKEIKRLGEILVAKQLISERDLTEALKEQQRRGGGAKGDDPATGRGA